MNPARATGTRLLGLLCLVTLLRTPSDAAPPGAGEDAARRAIEGRLMTLSSVALEFDVEETFLPTLAAPANGNGAGANAGADQHVVRTGISRAAWRFSYLDGRSRWECRPSPESNAEEVRKMPGFLPVTLDVRTFRPGAAESLVMRGADATGRIQPSAPIPSDWWVHVALGLWDGDFGGRGWLTPVMLRQMDFARDKDGRAVLSRRNDVGQLVEFVHDPKQEYALIVYRRYDTTSGAVVTEVTAGDMERTTNGILLPHTMAARRYHTIEKRDNYRWRATVTGGAVKPQDNTDEQYYIAWPKGARVADSRPPQPRVRRIEHDGEKITD